MPRGVVGELIQIESVPWLARAIELPRSSNRLPSVDKLRQEVKALLSKCESLRKHRLKETPTRTIVIDPLLAALGWDVRDPEEVQLEYPTVDGKSVDYALKINNKPILLVEAKPLDDPLDDVKGITQIVGYAANDGIVWCVLTNGLKWKVFRSVEQAAAPDKLMYEVTLDPREDQSLPLDELLSHLWRLSREEMANGTLDALGEQTFTDGKVRKALTAVLQDPPRQLLNIVRRVAGDQSLRPQQIKASLSRIWRTESSPVQSAKSSRFRYFAPRMKRQSLHKLRGPAKKRRHPPSYPESHHISGKPQEAVELYRAIDQFCLSLMPDHIERRFLAKYISYTCGTEIFCSLHIFRSGIRVWLKLKFSQLDAPPSFARDVSGVGHWGTGDLELAIGSKSQLEAAFPYVRGSFEACTR